MHAPETGSVDAVTFASVWGPRLLRFYFLLCANRKIAEAVTFRTLSEIIRSRRTAAMEISRLAVETARYMPADGTKAYDAIARAVSSLPKGQGCVIALSYGMDLALGEIAEATQTSLVETKRLFTDGVARLHQLLFVNEQRLATFRQGALASFTKS